MNPKRLSIRLAIALLLAISVVLLGSTVGLPRKEAGRGPATIALKAPAFVHAASPEDAERAGTSFLEQEAGFAAYINTGRTIYPVSIHHLFRTIERETSDYIIGSVAAPDYDENWDVHVYAHRDGWIVAYYLYYEPAVKITDWQHYTGAAALPTQIDNVLALVVNQVGGSVTNVGYYHFRFPNATHVMVAADYETLLNVTDTFQAQIPGTLTVYERAWLHAAYDINAYGRDASYFSQCQLNDTVLSTLQTRTCDNCWQTNYGTLDLTQLVPERVHTVKVYNPDGGYGGYNNPHSMCAISLVYQEASQ